MNKRKVNKPMQGRKMQRTPNEPKKAKHSEQS